MKLRELLEQINAEEETNFEIKDLRLDKDGDLWLYDPQGTVGFNLCRDLGNGSVIVYEGWGSPEDTLQNEYPDTEIVENDDNWKIQTQFSSVAEVYPKDQFSSLLEVVNHFLFMS